MGGKRTAGIVAAIMIGVVLGVNIVNAAVPSPDDPSLVSTQNLPTDPGTGGQPESTAPAASAAPGQTLAPVETTAPQATAAPIAPGPVAAGTSVEVGAHFQVVMPDGWTSIGETGGFLVFQKGSATVAVGGLGWNDTVLNLATAYQDEWFKAGQLTGEAPSTGTIGDGIPVAGLNYTGNINGAAVDGFILAAAEDGSGMILNAFGPTGILNTVGNDLDAIVKSIKRL